MERQARKAAVAAYKQRKTVSGVYAVRCAVSGEAWVGQGPDLATIQTRLWFSLRQGGQPSSTLQAAWQRHGAAQFTFEILETLDEDTPAYLRAARLNGLAAGWREKLTAGRI